MTRPETIDDLTPYERQGHDVATITPANITRHPALGQHLLAALAEAERLGLEIVEDTIRIPLTDDEQAARVATAQRNWDTGKSYYDRAVAGEPLETWAHYTVKRWCKDEGIDIPEAVLAEEATR